MSMLKRALALLGVLAFAFSSVASSQVDHREHRGYEPGTTSKCLFLSLADPLDSDAVTASMNDAQNWHARTVGDDLLWDLVETTAAGGKGHYGCTNNATCTPGTDPGNWAAFDNIVIQAQARNLQLYWFVWSTPSWAQDGVTCAISNKRMPCSLTDYADFLVAVIHRYKPGGVLAQSQGWATYGVINFGVWEEPNINQFFLPNDVNNEGSGYIALLRAAYGPAHAEYPGVQIMTGGLSRAGNLTTGTGCQSAATQGLIDNDCYLGNLYVRGLADVTDIIGVDFFPTTSESASSWATSVKTVRTLARNRGGDTRKPIWVMGMGWKGVNNPVGGTSIEIIDQAGRVSQLYNQTAPMMKKDPGWLFDRVCWFSWKDNVSDNGYGLKFTGPANYKPSAGAFGAAPE